MNEGLLSILNTSAGSIVIFTLFALLIIGMIVVALYGSKKERNRKQIEAMKTDDINVKASKSYKVIVFKIANTINILNYDVKNFKPSVGAKTMNQINEDARLALLDLKKSKDWEELKHSPKHFDVINPLVSKLTNTKPIQWEKNQYQALNILLAKAEALKQDNLEIYNEVLKGLK